MYRDNPILTCAASNKPPHSHLYERAFIRSAALWEGLEKGSGSGAIVVGAIPYLSEGFAIVVVMRPNNDDLVPELSIRAFNESEHILGTMQLSFNIDCEHRSNVRLRFAKFRQKLVV